MLDEVGALQSNYKVAVFGSWFNSILAASIIDKVSEVTGYDIDESAVKLGKRLYMDCNKNIKFDDVDVLKDFAEANPIYLSDVIINPSCEHMKPMYNYYWRNHKVESYCAFQSNNMFDIPDHINCVNSMEEFIAQMPSKARGNPFDFKVLLTDELDDSRGIRYTIVGKLVR